MNGMNEDIIKSIDTADKIRKHKMSLQVYILKSSMKEITDIPIREIPDYIEGTPQVSRTAVPPDYADADESEDEEPAVSEAAASEEATQPGKR